MTFSIITICFNDLCGLVSTHKSVISQDCDDYEWIVIDGESTDGSAEWLKNKHKAKGIWSSEPDNGIYDAMNKGLDLATGDYLIFMNSGDCFAENYTLSKISLALRDCEVDPDLVYGDSIDIFTDGGKLYRHSRGFEHIKIGMFTQHQAMFFRREFVGGWRYPSAFKYSGDYALVSWVVGKSKNILKLSIPICEFLMGGAHDKHRKKALMEDFKIRKSIQGQNFFFNLLLLVAHYQHFLVKKWFPFLFRFIRYKGDVSLLFLLTFWLLTLGCNTVFAAPTLVPLESVYQFVLKPGEEATFLLGLEDSNNILSIDLTVVDFTGRTISKQTCPLHHVGKGLSFLNLKQALDTRKFHGWFSVQAKAPSGTGSVIDSKVSFVVIPDDLEPSGLMGISGLWGFGGATSRLSDATASTLSSMGVHAIRFFAAWEYVKSPADWSALWQQIDSLLIVCQAHHIEILPVLVIAPEYAVDQGKCPSDANPRSRIPNLDQWKRFVDAITKRYGSYINNWEIWNEPDVKSFWCGNVKQYAELLDAAYPIIKNNISNSHILLGGTSGVDDRWVASVRNLTSSFDLVSLHSYRKVNSPPEIGSLGSGHYGQKPLAEDLQSVTRAAPNVPIWITETGLNTLPGRQGLFEAVDVWQQAARLFRQAIIARSCGVERVYWWMLEDTYGLGTGLIGRADGFLTPKPSLAAMAFLNRLIDKDTRVEIKEFNGAFIAYITNKKSDYTVLWSTANVSLKVKAGNQYYYNIDGSSSKIVGTDGIVEIDGIPKVFNGKIDLNL